MKILCFIAVFCVTAVVVTFVSVWGLIILGCAGLYLAIDAVARKIGK